MAPPVNLTITVPNRIGKIRKDHEKSQSQMVEDMDGSLDVSILLDSAKITRSTLATIEAGHMLPSLRMLAALCHYLQCKPDDLYEPYVLAVIGQNKKADWIKQGGYWDDK